ncbi:uncharacterized protein LOC112465192, partial [Temnothorax curvispinosus]|uniref:Uncharacterized protein LOC112465192 n=1 Tax=Temnothorax curvispinosus TaxID=300111 RepID=A0A6J1R1A1_9HYME
MEADVGAELVNESTILKETGLNVRVLIGDEDSSTIAAVRRGNDETIFKLADNNHLKKHFSKDLYELQKTFKEMKKRDVIPHLKKCFNYAVAQNKGKSVELASTLRTIPDHVFGKHENCGAWCHRDSNDIAASSQANESLNNIMAHKAPKNRCYSLSESADFRWASAVCAKNDGQQYLPRVSAKLCISPGKHMESFAIMQDKQRARRAELAKLQ